MKFKLKLPIKQMATAALLMGIASTGCKKDETKMEPPIQTTKMSEAELSKLLQYISITTGAPKDQIVFDEKEREFVVYGWFHKSLMNAQSEHDKANEYIANHEK